MASELENREGKRAARQDWFHDLLECVINAGVEAFCIILLGNVALSILRNVVGRMIPSAPPGLESTLGGTDTLQVWGHALNSIKFYLIFAVLLCFSLREKFVASDEATAPTTRWQQIRQRFSENWFGSVVVNAFVAMALATGLAAIPSLSAWQWCWHWLTNFATSRFDIATDSPTAGGWISHVKAWFNWYGDNQLRFNFWVIYLGAICDDFGIPNFKSLARWFWRKVRTKRTIPATGSDKTVACEQGNI